MKKYIKFETDLMRLFDKNKLKRFKWGVLDNNKDELVFTLDGNYAVIIPRVKFYLCDDLLDSRNEWKQFSTIFNMENYVSAHVVVSDIDDKGELYYKLNSATNEQVWVRAKNLKYFDFPATTTFAIKNDISPVMVFENGELVGVVMPIRWSDKYYAV